MVGGSTVKPGDLIKFINLAPYGEPEYLGVVLEHHETWVKMFWCCDVPEKNSGFQHPRSRTMEGYQ
jgi:hypothetical protein